MTSMTNPPTKCFNCSQKTDNTLYGFYVCKPCEEKIGLMSKETIQQHVDKNKDFKKEAQAKLAVLEKDYARKKIKLLHIIHQTSSPQ